MSTQNVFCAILLDMTLDDEIAAACDALVPPGSSVANFHNTAGWMKSKINWLSPRSNR